MLGSSLLRGKGKRLPARLLQSPPQPLQRQHQPRHPSTWFHSLSRRPQSHSKASLKLNTWYASSSQFLRQVILPWQLIERRAFSAKDLASQYERKTPEEHVLLRPGMYVGSVDAVEEDLFLFNKRSKRMELERVSYSPGLVKLFDEILVNAADNVERSKKMTAIHIDVDKKLNKLTVRNDGAGIPVVMHEKEKVYIPELVLGNLLTGSNFDDTVERFTGGRHGYGAKLANILSNYFRVETLDAERGLLFEMEWENHMKPVGSGAKITELSKAEVEARGGGYTEVSFIPDLSVFNMKKLDQGTLKVIDRRARDVAGLLSPSIQVFLDGKAIPVNSFEEFAALFFPETKSQVLKNMATYTDDKWRVLVLRSPLEGDALQQSFVNRMATSRGGQHVNHIMSQIEPAILDAVTKKIPKSSEAKITRKSIRQKVAVFVDCRIPNPSFDTQVKDKLTSTINAKSGCTLSKDFMTSLVKKTKIVDGIVAEILEKEENVLARAPRKTSRKAILGIPKLEDANWAGTNQSKEATLILTEGDSAKALAVAGLPVVGRDRYGVFPLRGKLLNVRDATKRAILKNEEVNNLCAILGLDFKKKYTTEKEISTLRYGRVMLMTDQDYDGSHIKGLLINLFHFFWPELIKRPGFLCEFVTPLVKISPGRKSEGRLSFFTMQDYEKWLMSNPNKRGSNLNVKYYKGLGTSTSAEAREYFGNLPKHVLDFAWPSTEDTKQSAKARAADAEADQRDSAVLTAENAGELIDLAFNKKRAQDRRDWISLAMRQQALGNFHYVDHSESLLRFDDFINQELVLFSQHDVARSLPSSIDGLKPSQRKVLFASFKRNLVSKELKVAQLAGFCGEQTAYHHGEQSLHQTIINMAQDFVGSNNLPLLYPAGQFGTRLQGGRDAASPRYIFTRLQSYTRALFPKEDDALLERNEDDGILVEPVVYKPVIPMALINGAEGIGTGWSTYVPAHSPLDVIANVRRKIHGEPMIPMKPWYHGFKGEINPLKSTSKGFRYSEGFESSGIIERVATTRARITELPIGRWTEDFKITLRNLVTEDVLTDFTEHHDERTVCFEIKGKKDNLDNILKDSSALRTTSRMLASNMHLIDGDGRVQKFTTPEQIIEAFYPVRLDLYVKRREVMLADMQYRVKRLQNQARFVREIGDGKLVVHGKSKAAILELLETNGFLAEHALGNPGDSKNAIKTSIDPQDALEEEEKEDESETSGIPANLTKGGLEAKAYDYLLNIPIWDLTRENVDKIERELVDIEKEYADLLKSRAEDLWLRDLDNLEELLAGYLAA